MQQGHKRHRGETVMVTFRFPKELYDRLPVERAPNAGKQAGVSGFLRPLLIDAVERELAAHDAQAT